MKRWRRNGVIAGAVGFPCLLVALFHAWAAREQVTTCRLSPDETLRVWLVELHMGVRLDRNFAIRLERSVPLVGQGVMVDLLQGSDDEGRPEGTERFLWSRDGSKVLLVGRHFYVRDDLMLEGGDQAYFLHDVPSGRSWMNSETVGRFPPLTTDLIAGVEFTEPVILKPRPKVAPDSPQKGK